MRSCLETSVCVSLHARACVCACNFKAARQHAISPACLHCLMESTFLCLIFPCRSTRSSLLLASGPPLSSVDPDTPPSPRPIPQLHTPPFPPKPRLGWSTWKQEVRGEHHMQRPSTGGRMLQTPPPSLSLLGRNLQTHSCPSRPCQTETSAFPG